MKNTSKQKTIQKLFSVMPKHVDILKHFIEDGRALSESDVVRQALLFFHDKTYPNYIFQLSPAGEVKKRNLDKVLKHEAIPDEEFAKSLKAWIKPDVDGTPFAIIHQIANMCQAVPLSQLKEFAATHKQDIDLHRAKVKEESVEDAVYASTYKRRDLKDRFNIVIEPREVVS